MSGHLHNRLCMAGSENVRRTPVPLCVMAGVCAAGPCGAMRTQPMRALCNTSIVSPDPHKCLHMKDLTPIFRCRSTCHHRHAYSVSCVQHTLPVGPTTSADLDTSRR